MDIRIVGSSSVATLLVAGLLALAGCSETTSVSSCTAGPGVPCTTTPPNQASLESAGPRYSFW